MFSTMIEVIGISSEPPRPSSQHKGDSFAPERQRTGNKRQRQEIEDEGEGEGNKEKGAVVFVLEDKGLPLDREETDVAHRQLAVYKGTRGNAISGGSV